MRSTGRKLVLLTSSGLALLSFVFALQAALNLRQLWLLYVVIALQAHFSRSINRLDRPSSRDCCRPIAFRRRPR